MRFYLIKSDHLTVQHHVDQNSAGHFELKRGEIVAGDLSDAVDGRSSSTKRPNDAVNPVDATPVDEVLQQVDDVRPENVENSAAVVVIAHPRKCRVVVDADETFRLESNVDQRRTVGADEAVAEQLFQSDDGRNESEAIVDDLPNQKKVIRI